MRIGFLTRWNASCATSILAELLGREWIKEGHKLRVYAPLNDPRLVNAKDEDYIVRCYSMVSKDWRKTQYIFHKETLLQESHDIFIVQKVDFVVPVKELFETLSIIKRRGTKIVYIFHERKVPFPDNALFSLFKKFDWDAIICFDNRYKLRLVKYFSPHKIHIIPFPTHPIVCKNVTQIREKLGLPLDAKIILSFGWRIIDILKVLPTLNYVNKIYPFYYVVLTNPEHYSYRQVQQLISFTQKLPNYKGEIQPIKCLHAIQEHYKFIRFVYDSPSIERLYDYLLASDLILVHKERPPKDEIVISSTVFFALGSLTPIITSDTEYVETLKNEVIKYKNLEHLKEILLRALKDTQFLEEIRKCVMKCVQQISANRIAKEYMRLFEQLLSENVALSTYV